MDGGAMDGGAMDGGAMDGRRWLAERVDGGVDSGAMDGGAVDAGCGSRNLCSLLGATCGFLDAGCGSSSIAERALPRWSAAWFNHSGAICPSVYPGRRVLGAPTAPGQHAAQRLVCRRSPRLAGGENGTIWSGPGTDRVQQRALPAWQPGAVDSLSLTQEAFAAGTGGLLLAWDGLTWSAEQMQFYGGNFNAVSGMGDGGGGRGTQRDCGVAQCFWPLGSRWLLDPTFPVASANLTAVAVHEGGVFVASLAATLSSAPPAPPAAGWRKLSHFRAASAISRQALPSRCRTTSRTVAWLAHRSPLRFGLGVAHRLAWARQQSASRSSDALGGGPERSVGGELGRGVAERPPGPSGQLERLGPTVG